jgi:S1-C subfamily serine protease
MRLAALAAALLLAPTVAAAPRQPPEIVRVAVGHDRATGFVAGDGLVVTVAHVLGDEGRRAGDDVVDGGGPVAEDAVVGGGGPVAEDAVVGGGDLVVDGRPAEVVRIDRRSDLALLRVEGVSGEPEIGGGGDTRLLGRAAPILRHISARVDGGPPRPAIEVRADIAAGDSGAPLLTSTGRVAGVVFARSRTRARIAYAVDATAVAQLLR